MNNANDTVRKTFNPYLQEVNMAFWRNSIFGRKKDRKNVQVEAVNKRKPEGIGEMAAGNLKAAADSVAQMMEEKNLATKILAVQDGTSSTVLVDYVLKMAHKLDCEIIALDVSDEPLQHLGERRKRETNRFYERAKMNAESLKLKAEVMGVTCRHEIRVGNQEETIKALSEEDKCIRYVLTKPVQEQVNAEQKRARIPVFDLSCSRL